MGELGGSCRSWCDGLNWARFVHRESADTTHGMFFRNGRSVVEGLSSNGLFGPDGLILLLSLLAAGELPTAELIEMAKQVQNPGYEPACNLMELRNLQQVLPPSLGYGCYLQSEIAELIRNAMTDQRRRGRRDSNPRLPA